MTIRTHISSEFVYIFILRQKVHYGADATVFEVIEVGYNLYTCRLVIAAKYADSCIRLIDL